MELGLIKYNISWLFPSANMHKRYTTNIYGLVNVYVHIFLKLTWQKCLSKATDREGLQFK